MLVTARQIIAAEEAAFARGVNPAELMDEAGAGIADAIRQFFPQPATAVLFLGKGHNAGDALVAARHLLDAGWKVLARPSCGTESVKPLPASHWRDIRDRVPMIAEAAALRTPRGPLVLLDGLTGTGATSEPLRSPLAEAVEEMNVLRRERHAFTVALDLPSGLGTGGPCVQADLTVTIGHGKTILFDDKATDFVGRLAVVPLAALAGAEGDTSAHVLTARELLPLLPCRSFDFHKGRAGRVAIIAGSRGFSGAAVLAASGALHGGAGLVTLCVNEHIHSLIAPLCPPEIMVRPVHDYRDILKETWDAIAIGPGLGQQQAEQALDVIAKAKVPTVVDADALNLLAAHGLDALRHAAAPRLLTPHPGEMARLVANVVAWNSHLSRADTARSFAARHPDTTLLLKGARTVIATAGKPLAYNTTGHPGMATGGVGDVLTGLCAALIAQGVGCHEAACLGSWLSGRAAERALTHGGDSQESLSAGSVVRHLGGAFRNLRELAF